ncbi:MAG: PoNe immunity protein domain-containing protein [Lachnospiraceae bacterium]
MNNRLKDDFKTIEYFQKELKHLETRIKRYRDNLCQENASRLYIAIGIRLLSVISIEYQLGYEIDEIKQTVLEYIENDKRKVQYCGGNITYNDAANILSLAYLFHIDSKQVEFIKEYMVEEKYIDICLDLIRNIYFEGKCYSTKDFYYKDKGYFGERSKEHGGIVDIYNASDAERTDLFLKHLDVVKDKHYRRLIKYYETLDEDRYTYVGSYDFILTAVAKALKLDKSRLSDSKYIALDLL